MIKNENFGIQDEVFEFGKLLGKMKRELNKLPDSKYKSELSDLHEKLLEVRGELDDFQYNYEPQDNL